MMTKMAKLLVLLAGIVFLAVIGQLGLYIHSHIQVNRIAKQEAYAQDIYQQIESMFINQESGFITKEMTEFDLLNIREDIDELGESVSLSPTLIGAYNDLQWRYFAQQEVNGMFSEAVIVDDIINSNVPYIEEITHDYVQTNVGLYRYSEVSDFFEETINLLIDDALSQTSYFDLASSKLDELKHIPIQAGHYQTIAQGMKEAEEAYGHVYNQTLQGKLNEAFQTYASEFIQTVNSTVQNIEDNQELQNAMEISPYIKRILIRE